MTPVCGSRTELRVGRSVARGRRPAAVFRFLWYLFGLSLYAESSLSCSLLVSFLLQFFMMSRIVLLHILGMCSRAVCGVVGMTIAACSRMWAGVGGGEGCFVGLWVVCEVDAEWAMARKLEIRLIWRSCALVMGV